MKNIFKNKKKTIIFFTILVILFLMFNIFTQLSFYGNRLDFLWNYSFGLQITKGILPYSGYNMVPTPLLAFSTALFLKVFSTNIVSYAVFMAILKVTLLSLVSLITTKLLRNNTKYDKYYIFIISFVLLNILLSDFYFEYNFFAILFLLSIILLEISIYKNKKDTILNNILIGFLAGLSILSKQSVGLFICLFVVIKPLLFNKENKMKNLIYRVIGILIPCLAFLIYLLLTNSFDDFMSYAVLGIKEFNNSYPYYVFLSEVLEINRFPINVIYFIAFASIFITVLIYIIHRFYIIIKSKNKYYFYIESLVFFYSLSAFACMYPIRDLTHLAPAIMPLSALIIVYAYSKIKDVFKKLPKKFNIICISWLSIIAFIISIYPVYKYLGIKYKYDNKTGFNTGYYVILDDNYGVLSNLAFTNHNVMAIDAVMEYEKENDCLILETSAAMFHLVTNKYYKDYDLFMRGNFGVDGEDRLIEDLESRDNIKVLISNDPDIKSKNDQIPKKVINYVLDSYEKIDSVAYFDVYVRKDK